MLALFRQNSTKQRTALTEEFHKDLTWFVIFFPKFNGITYIRMPDIPGAQTFHLDASLTGLGGVWNNQVYGTPILDIYDIPLKLVHLEMLNLVIALKLWARYWAHSAVKFYCDNLAVVQVVHTGKTSDNMLAPCLRNIWLITASYDIDLHINHIQGRAIKITDLLSCIYSPKTVDLSLLQQIRETYIWHRIPMQFFYLNSII